MELSVTFPAFSETSATACRARWDSIAKPLGSLGLLEDAVVRISGLTGDADYIPGKRAVAVICADNGVVARGVTQTGSEVTAVVARNMTTGAASVCKMAETARADVIPVDMGMLADMRLPGLLDRRVAAGTGDIASGPAMTREQAALAVTHGIELVKTLKNSGYKIIVTGEMGIGNTTTSSAMASVLLGLGPEAVTGRGAGLPSEALDRKVKVIQQAIRINTPDPSDPLDILAKLGGFDIAGIVGLFIGGAACRVPIVIDGLISSVAALTALRIFPEAGRAMLASHVSAEPAGGLLLDALGLQPVITAGMFLGEGTGGVALLPLLDMAYTVYRGMPTFEDTRINPYVSFEEENGFIPPKMPLEDV